MFSRGKLLCKIVEESAQKNNDSLDRDALQTDSRSPSPTILTDISNNLVNANPYPIETISEDFSPSEDEDYIPNSEDDSECEYFYSRREVSLRPVSSEAHSNGISLDTNINLEVTNDLPINKDTLVINNTDIVEINNNTRQKNDDVQLIDNSPVNNNDIMQINDISFNTDQEFNSLIESNIQVDNGLEITSASESQSSRKRSIDKSKWKCNVRKENVITGQSYISKKGKFVPQKAMKPPCMCRLECYNKLNEQTRLDIFAKYYKKEMTWDLKRQFIVSRVTEIPTKRTRRSNPDQPPKRDKTLIYSFIVNGDTIKVCKKIFLNTLSISETVVRNAVKKSMNGFAQEERRGRHPPPNKKPETLKDTARKHINSIPKYESHYSRNRTKRQYLGSHFNIDKLYSLYLEYCNQNNISDENVAKPWLYRHIFNTEFNLGFNPPANDTCDDCDGYVVKYKNEKDEAAKNTLQTQHDNHLIESDRRYNMKKLDKKEAKESNDTKKMLTMDLQKCLPTPCLTNGQSFYFRKLWTFNFTLLDAAPKESWCFMWDESVAGRGGNEMASGVVKFAENITDECHELTIWSDNCAGQNKNISLILAYILILTKKTNIKIINHKYLLKGHTHMEVDTIHSVIERSKKNMKEFSIMTPWDWQQFVRNCSNKSTVVNMETNDFKNFASYCEGTTSSFVHRKKSVDGEIVPYSSIVWMQFRQDNIGSMFYKTSFDQNNFEEVNLVRNHRKDLVISDPKPIRNTAKPISKAKYNDLMKTLQWVPTVFHNFYKNLPRDDVPDLPEPDN